MFHDHSDRGAHKARPPRRSIVPALREAYQMDQINQRHRAHADVEATILAHGEDGDGWCAGDHDEPERYPCQARLWMEEASDRHKRRLVWP
jgi:hypothetical protein